MTIKQKQWQLFYLGYYGETTDDIDGYWGPKSEEATREFQEAVGIKVDGVFGNHTCAKSKEMVAAIQDVISSYSKNGLVEDGLAGPATMSATIWYQKEIGLTPDGIAGEVTRGYILTEDPNTKAPIPSTEPDDKELTGTFWDEIKYFTRDEFKCKCGGRYCNGFPAEPQESMVRVADRAREYFGKPAKVISGLRCRQHNANEGGVANSQHMYGEAVDLYIQGVTAEQQYQFILKQPEIRYTYKINSSNVHFDIPKGAR